MSKYKTYVLNRIASQYSLYIQTDKVKQFVTFSSIGYGSIYSTGAPQFSTANTDVQS